MSKAKLDIACRDYRLLHRVASILIVLATVLITEVSAQNALLRDIDRLKTSAAAYARRNPNNAIVVADVADYDEKSQWKRFDSPRELEMFAEENPVYTSALNWFRKQQLLLTSITYSSPSGDWARYVTYIFRKDGSVAAITDELRTFYGNCINLTNIYLAKNGRILRRQTRSFDLITNKPIKKICDTGTSTQILYSSKELPFFQLLTE